ncbi:MAG: ubiquinol-cytochrome c reductase iron-sulfur subunit [Hyphomicrobiaceae bacterium]
MESSLTAEVDGTTRRDFLTLAGPAFFAVGGVMTLWPFIDQMNPDAGALALASIEVDLEPISEGQAITVMWRGKPVFIRYRTVQEVEEAKTVDLNDLPDPQSDQQRTKQGHEQWLVMEGICTHLGCIPKGQSLGDSKGDFGGWFCPCHGSHYDTAGRIRKGPAPRNLIVPPYEFVSDSKIKIG